MFMGSALPVPESLARAAWVDAAGYARMYEESVRDPETFWGKEGKRLHWVKPYTRVKSTSFTGDVSIRWYEDGTLNASYNCVDRHLATRADPTAIIWEGDSPQVPPPTSSPARPGNGCRPPTVPKPRA